MVRFGQACAAARAGKLEKIALLAEHFRSLDDADLSAVARFFTGNPFAARDDRNLGIGWRTIVAAAKNVWGFEEAQLSANYLCGENCGPRHVDDVGRGRLCSHGRNGTPNREFGQLILAACFFTHLGTVATLGLLFANYNLWLALLTAGIVAGMLVMPKLLPAVVERTRRYVSEPGLRILFAVIFVLAALATYAKSEGVLPAYFLGIACAGFMFTYPDVKRRLQTMTMKLLAPFYFIKAGTYISFSAAAGSAWLIVILFFIKIVAKVAAVLPIARYAFRYTPNNASYLTLMMATGLTFGTISSLYGLTHHYINQAQYTALVTVVILTAIMPTLVAPAQTASLCTRSTRNWRWRLCTRV
jgi:hypothetical protein